MPGAVLNDLQTLHLLATNRFMSWIIICVSYKWGNPGSEKLSSMPKDKEQCWDSIKSAFLQIRSYHTSSHKDNFPNHIENKSFEKNTSVLASSTHVTSIYGLSIHTQHILKENHNREEKTQGPEHQYKRKWNRGQTVNLRSRMVNHSPVGDLGHNITSLCFCFRLHKTRTMPMPSFCFERFEDGILNVREIEIKMTTK